METYAPPLVDPPLVHEFVHKEVFAGGFAYQIASARIALSRRAGIAVAHQDVRRPLDGQVEL